VDEFFNALCDRMEAALKNNHTENHKASGSADPPPPMVDLVKETFGGELEHQLLCQDCPHTSYRTEPFSALPLSVANKATVQVSLDQFITGEMLEGDNSYMCHTCNRKVRTLKRVCIKTLPNVLVLNLKRFEVSECDD
jgi:ubiquitin carboxyl-terminal hydrolase 34